MRAKTDRIVELGGHASTTGRIVGRRMLGQVKLHLALRVPDIKTNIYRACCSAPFVHNHEWIHLLQGAALAKNLMTA
jgi:hypothetical protein